MVQTLQALIDFYPLPNIDQLRNRISEVKPKYFSVYLKGGFYQLALHPDSRYLSAFIINRGLYQFKRMPMDWTNAPGEYQRYLSHKNP